MKDQSKTKQVLIRELVSLRRRIAELEQSESEREKLSDELRLDSEILANMMEGVHLTRADDSIIVYTNPRFESMFGYNPGELLGKHVSIVNAPGDKSPEDVANEIIKSLKQAGAWRGEVHNLRKDGTSFWCYANVSKFEHPQYGEVWISVHQDITDRKQTENALRLSEKRFRYLLQSVPTVAVQGYGPDGTTQYWNQASEHLYGYTAQEATGRNLVDLIIPPEMRGEVERAIQQMAVTGQPIPASELSLMRKDGSRVSVYSSHAIVQIPGQTSELFCIDIDLTDCKRVEEALRESEEKYRSLIENIHDGIYILDCFGKFMFVNDVIVQRSGFPEEWFFARSYLDVTIEKDREPAQRHFNEVMDGKTNIYDLSYPTESGNLLHVQVSTTPLFDGAKVIGLLGVSRDITERKIAEAQLNASLQEKEILLKELHHRVKNSMQVISGLLDLQARSTGNPELAGMLNKSQSRIRSMTLVHEKLYGSKDLARIDLGGYVRALSQELFQSYKINPGKIDLIIRTDGDIYVDINKAVPCGLILNEMISNSLKHAFPGDRHGELWIIIHETKNTEIEIIVRDDGIGLPDDVDFHQPRTMGLYLVNGLTKNQLDGRIEVRRDNGTEFRVKFAL